MKCKTKKCGCIDTGLITQPPCAHDTPACPNPDPCSETISDCCVIHNGDGIAELNIQTGDRVCDIWQKVALAISASTGVTIQSVTVVGNDLIITMTDGTIFSTPLPAATVPNDPWIALDQDDMTLILPAYTATVNSILINFSYKIMNIDTVAIKGRLRLDVTTTALNNSINFNFRWPAFSGSNWFVGTKVMTATMGRVPVTIVNNTNPLVETASQVGTVIASNIAGLNLLSLGETTLNLPNDNYILDVHFELLSPLQ